MIRAVPVVAVVAVIAAVLPALPAAADERAARREAADYHAMFEIRDLAPPAALREDGTGRCRGRGIVHILFRGPRDVPVGRAGEIVFRCRAGGGGEGGGPALYDHADPDAPVRLIVWFDRFEDRLVAVDWVAPGF